MNEKKKETAIDLINRWDKEYKNQPNKELIIVLNADTIEITLRNKDGKYSK